MLHLVVVVLLVLITIVLCLPLHMAFLFFTCSGLPTH